MRTDLANRTGHHNYTVDVDSPVSPPPVSAPDPLTLGDDQLFVVNYSKQDKTVNISQDRLSNDVVQRK